jgi:hypothetical protein
MLSRCGTRRCLSTRIDVRWAHVKSQLPRDLVCTIVRAPWARVPAASRFSLNFVQSLALQVSALRISRTTAPKVRGPGLSTRWRTNPLCSLPTVPASPLTVRCVLHSPPRPDSRLQPRPAKEGLVFGASMTDHMLEVDWTAERGWGAPAIVPYANLQLDPAASVLHYGVEVRVGSAARLCPRDPVLAQPLAHQPRIPRHLPSGRRRRRPFLRLAGL